MYSYTILDLRLIENLKARKEYVIRCTKWSIRSILGTRRARLIAASADLSALVHIHEFPECITKFASCTLPFS